MIIMTKELHVFVLPQLLPYAHITHFSRQEISILPFQSLPIHPCISSHPIHPYHFSQNTLAPPIIILPILGSISISSSKRFSNLCSRPHPSYNSQDANKKIPHPFSNHIALRDQYQNRTGLPFNSTTEELYLYTLLSYLTPGPTSQKDNFDPSLLIISYPNPLFKLQCLLASFRLLFLFQTPRFISKICGYFLCHPSRASISKLSLMTITSLSTT